MNRTVIAIRRLLVVALSFWTSLACSSLDGSEEEVGRDLGMLVLPLETQVSHGVRYRLKDASFTISAIDGSVTKYVNTDDRKTDSIRVELSAGAYEVSIASKAETFRIDRVLRNGTTTAAVNVELASPSSQTVVLSAGVDTRLVFKFDVDGAALGFGELLLEIEVTERTDGGMGGANDGSAGAASAGAGGMAGEGPEGGAGAGGSGEEPVGGSAGSGPTACNDCLNADPQLPPNYNGACTDIAECAAVRECVVTSNCYQVGKSPSECYCGVGADINDCQTPAFVPTGACVAEIVAAMARDGEELTNANMVGVLASDATTSGKAFQILIAVSQAGICVPECTLK